MPIRLLCFIKRLPGVSFEQFDYHWKNTHGRLVATAHVQLHTIPQSTELLESATLPVMAYDGIAEFHAETVEEVLQMFGSQEYQEKVAFDEATLGFDRVAVQVLAGEDHIPEPL